MDMFERRRVDIRCLQEVSYRGQGTRVYGGEEKYKFWWSRSEEGRNGVRIMVKENLVEEVIEVKGLDDRMVQIAMVCGRKILQVFSVYVSQQGRAEKRNREFFEKLSDNIHDVPLKDFLMVAGDMNCHNGLTRDDSEDVMRCFSFGVKNQEQENILGLCLVHKLRFITLYYRKRWEHLITYKSGGK